MIDAKPAEVARPARKLWPENLPSLPPLALTACLTISDTAAGRRRMIDGRPPLRMRVHRAPLPGVRTASHFSRAVTAHTSVFVPR